MPGRIITYRSRLPVSAERLFEWHTRPAAFDRLNPPWNPAKVKGEHPGVFNGSELAVRIKAGPVPITWRVRHQDVRPPHGFDDVQVSGPFAEWHHVHRFVPEGPDQCVLEDQMTVSLPGGTLGNRSGAYFLMHELDRVFPYRHRVTVHDLLIQHQYKLNPMKIGMTGATGFIGTQLRAFLSAMGHEVKRFVRSEGPARGDDIGWDPGGAFFESGKAEGLDVVIHLAGENIAGIWTEAKKRRIRDSRVEGTRNLVKKLRALDEPPKLLLCASAIGYYGDRGAELLDEQSPAGDGFMAEVVSAWEEAADAARDVMRVVKIRTGLVLSPEGGLLKPMILPFKLGLGAKVGSGDGYISWIAMDDYLGAAYHCIANTDLDGAVNFVTPVPVTQKELTKAVAAALSRPALFTIPEALLKLAPGNMAEETMLMSSRVEPARLKASGFDFAYPEIHDALNHVLGNQTADAKHSG